MRFESRRVDLQSQCLERKESVSERFLTLIRRIGVDNVAIDVAIMSEMKVRNQRSKSTETTALKTDARDTNPPPVAPPSNKTSPVGKVSAPGYHLTFVI